MKIIPLVLVLGATPLMAQSPAAKPKAAATPVKSQAKGKANAKATPEKAAEKEEAKPERQARRHRRVSRNPAPPPRPVITPEAEQPPRQTARKTQGEPEVAEAEAPKKKGGPLSIFGKIFGGRQEKPEAEAATEGEIVGPPAPTPAPRQPSRRAPSQQEVASIAQEVDEEAHLPTHQPRRQQQPQGPPVAVHRTVSNARGEIVEVELNDDLPGVSGGRQSAAPVYVNPNALPSPTPAPQAEAPQLPTAGPATAAAVSFDRDRYRETRKKAAADPAISALGDKLNATTPGDEAHSSAARAYTTALFEKMRELDPEQSDWISRMESATLRRIEAGKPVLAD